MRVVRFLIVVMGMAAMVAGCTQQPVAYMVYPPGTAPYPAAGIDGLRYRRAVRPAETCGGLCAAAECGGSNSSAKSRLCRRTRCGCTGRLRPRLHDGAGPRRCDVGAIGRAVDGCAANGRRACGCSGPQACACCFGSSRSRSDACACGGCCASAGADREAGACCFSNPRACARAGTGGSRRSAGRAGGLRTRCRAA
jgi:hypothetical protein